MRDPSNVMPNHTASDPLVPLPFRVPASLKLVLQQAADAAGCTVSDVLRSHLILEVGVRLGKRPPRRRPPTPGPVNVANPQLLRALASIGSNLNQIARVLNTGFVNGQPLELIESLVLLRSIESQIQRLANIEARTF